MARTTKSQNKEVASDRTRDRAAILEERRKVRGDMGTYQNLLTYPEDETLHFRYVNDSNDRIARLQRLGWRVWEVDNFQVGDASVIDNNIDGVSGVRVPVGKGMTAVLMCIEKELWDADQELKEESIRETEKAMGKQAKGKGLDVGELNVNYAPKFS